MYIFTAFLASKSVIQDDREYEIGCSPIKLTTDRYFNSHKLSSSIAGSDYSHIDFQSIMQGSSQKSYEQAIQMYICQWFYHIVWLCQQESLNYTNRKAYKNGGQSYFLCDLANVHLSAMSDAEIRQIFYLGIQIQ